MKAGMHKHKSSKIEVIRRVLFVHLHVLIMFLHYHYHIWSRPMILASSCKIMKIIVDCN